MSANTIPKTVGGTRIFTDAQNLQPTAQTYPVRLGQNHR